MNISIRCAGHNPQGKAIFASPEVHPYIHPTYSIHRRNLNMYCYRKVQDDLYWIGANDRRLALFEGVYDVPRGVSYNSYVLLDEKNVLFDTVD